MRGCRVVVKSVKGGSHSVSFRVNVAVHLFDRLVAVEALRPAHLVFIDHLKATFSAIPEDQRIDN